MAIYFTLTPLGLVRLHTKRIAAFIAKALLEYQLMLNSIYTKDLKMDIDHMLKDLLADRQIEDQVRFERRQRRKRFEVKRQTQRERERLAEIETIRFMGNED